MAKKTERKRLDKQCLDLWSKCCRAKQKTCRYNNSDEGLTTHHIIEKNYRFGRFALENGLVLSWRVHCLQKSHPEQFRDIVLEIIGEDEFNRLKERFMYQPACKRSIHDLMAIRDDLKRELQQLESDWSGI